MMKIKLALVLVAALACARTAEGQSDWYVDANATGPGTGTQIDPFPTIPAALGHPGLDYLDVIHVRPGIYDEPIELGLPVILRSTDGPSVTVITGSHPHLIRFHGGGLFAPATELIGFHIRGNGIQTGISMYMSRLAVLRCVLSDLGEGVDAFSSDLWVYHCDVTRCARGVRAGGTHISDVGYSVLWGNTENLVSSLFNIRQLHNLFADPQNLGPNDFHRTASSGAIDAGPVGPFAYVDPDSTRSDLGAIWYDASYPLGETVCFNAPNSTGHMGRLRAEGTTSLSAMAAGANLSLQVDRCPPNSFGLFLWGTELSELPISAGTLCVGGHITRLSLASTNASGTAHYVLPPQLSSRLDPGDSRPMQFWHRSPVPPGAALTGAVMLHFRN